MDFRERIFEVLGLYCKSFSFFSLSKSRNLKDTTERLTVCNHFSVVTWWIVAFVHGVIHMG